MKKWVVVLLWLVSACTEIHYTKLRPIGPNVFQYEAFAGPAYPLDSERAEAARLSWLEERLKAMGYGDRPYTILAREPIPRPWPYDNAYDLYYTVRVEP